MTEAFVLDASVTMVWCFEDEDQVYARRVLALMPRVRAHVPGLWSIEVGNILAISERAGRIAPAQSEEFIRLLSSFPITVDTETADRALGPSLACARKRSLTNYDAVYLELAMRRGLPLATQDKKLRRAAEAGGVSLI